METVSATSKGPNEQVAKEVAKLLNRCQCLKLDPQEPFTYASGLKGPIYCDNRKILAFPKERKHLWQLMQERFLQSFKEAEVIVGVATAGIAHACALAQNLDLPLSYARSKPKEHGSKQQVEGAEINNRKIVVVEDLVNQGKSIGQVLEAIKNYHSQVLAAFSIVDYQMPSALLLFKDLQIPLVSMTNFKAIVEVAVEEKSITKAQETLLWQWHEAPEKWSP